MGCLSPSFVTKVHWSVPNAWKCIKTNQRVDQMEKMSDPEIHSFFPSFRFTFWSSFVWWVCVRHEVIRKGERERVDTSTRKVGSLSMSNQWEGWDERVNRVHVFMADTCTKHSLIEDHSKTARASTKILSGKRNRDERGRLILLLFFSKSEKRRDGHEYVSVTIIQRTERRRRNY